MLNTHHFIRGAGAALILAGVSLWTSAAQSQVLAMSSDQSGGSVHRGAPQERGIADDTSATAQTTERLRRQVVEYPTAEQPGTIIIDTPHTYLYFVLGGGRAMRYGIGVGREGFTWAGVKTIERMSEWPDWIPPAEMLQRQPYLPRFMAGGPGNPLGARAMYLGGTVYRIHGTNAPDTIGERVSSGCIRMVNDDVIDLYSRTRVGTKVIVMPIEQPPLAQSLRPIPISTHVTSTRVRTSSAY
jgi:lipoprotein-anchoring transpeptidase ErfK/SrfK